MEAGFIFNSRSCNAVSKISATPMHRTVVMWMVGLLLLLLGLATPSLAQTSCASGSVRVVPFTNLSVTYAGFVEVCLNGVWGTVCADSPTTLWSEKNAQVFCRGLGYTGALNPVDQSTILPIYYPTTTPINYKSVRCDGTETSLSQCSHSENTTGCTHASDAAVVCRLSASDGDLRLVGSTANGQGAVEIYSMGSQQWYRACPTGWTSSYASVACQRLGYQSGVASTYSLGSGGLLTTSVTCGSASSQCSSSGYTSCSGTYAGIICSSSANRTDSIRLSGGSRASTGRVEVLYNGVWGTVCNISGWTFNEAQAVCNLLGYTNSSTVSITSLSFYGLSSLYPVWISGLTCGNYSVTNISQCAYSKPIGYGQFCTHNYDALLDCQSSSSSNLAGLGALALVAAVPAAGARFAGKLAAIICRMLGSCLNCTQSALNSLKLLLCCCFVASTLPSHRRRSSVLAPPDEVVITTTTTTTTTTTPQVHVDMVITKEPDPPYIPVDSELQKAPPPTYQDASKFVDAPPELPPPQYNVPPPQYSVGLPDYPGAEVSEL